MKRVVVDNLNLTGCCLRCLTIPCVFTRFEVVSAPFSSHNRCLQVLCSMFAAQPPLRMPRLPCNGLAVLFAVSFGVVTPVVRFGAFLSAVHLVRG